MIGELITTAYTFNQGRVLINNAFSGTAQFAGLAVKYVSTGDTYYIQPGDTFIVQTGIANVILPEPNSETRIIIVKNFGAGDVDVVPYASGGIDGQVTGATLSPLQSITVQTDGTDQWYITNFFG